MIEVKNIKKKYRKINKKGVLKNNYQDFEAVKNISMKIEEGKIVGLLGINGSGKTTTIKMLSTLLTPDSGSIVIDNMDSVKDGKQIRSIINMIAGGERMIYWRLTPRENLQYFGSLYGIDKEVLDKRIDELLSFVGLLANADQPVETFSKGMKQRLQIARGLINNPKYIFLDEPTLGLDVSIASEIRKFLKKLADINHKGILLTSHYINEIEEICDYIYVIDNGLNFMEGTPENIINKLSTYKEKFIIKVSNIDENLKLELMRFSNETNSLVDFDLNNSEIKVVITNNNVQEHLLSIIYKYSNIIKFTSDSPTLEEVMLKLSEGKKE